MEYFSGCESIVRGFRELGLTAQGVDYVTDGCAHDLLSTTGFLYAIRQILRVKEGGLNFWGLPCNSFSFMARSLHQRTADSPFGCQHHGFVIAGNILATRMVCLIALAIVRRLRFFVEQPDRSMAIVFPYLMHIMSFTQIEPQRVFWWMGTFGGWSQKPEFGIGNCSWMGKLFRPMGPGYRLQIKARAAAQKREMTKKSVHKVTQKPQVTGGRSLKDSAQYPRDFGREIAKLHVESMADGAPVLDLAVLIAGGFKDLPDGCDWSHGNFRGLLEIADYAGRHGSYQPDPDVPLQIEPSPEAFAKLKARLEDQG